MYLGDPYPNTTIQDAINKITDSVPEEGDTLFELYNLIINLIDNAPLEGNTLGKLYNLINDINSDNQIVLIYDSKSLFPILGDTTKLYLSKEDARVYLWDSVNSNYYTKIITDTIYLSFNSKNNYVTFNSNIWEAGPQFIFKGSQFLNNIENIKISSHIVATRSPILYDIRLFDITNNLVITEFLGLINENEMVSSSNIFNNIPTNEAIFQIQGKVYNTRNEIRLSSFLMEFKG